MLRGYGLAEPALTEPALTDAGRLMRSTFHGFVSIEATGGFGHPRAVQASWERIVSALDRTLADWPSSSEGEGDVHADPVSVTDSPARSSSSGAPSRSVPAGGAGRE
jgi:hypothetical protein